MYVFMHERCQLYDLKIKWSSEREIIPLKIQSFFFYIGACEKRTTDVKTMNLI